MLQTTIMSVQFQHPNVLSNKYLMSVNDVMNFLLLIQLISIIFSILKGTFYLLIKVVKTKNSNKEVNIFHAFKKSLVACFVQRNLTHTQGNIILRTLRSLLCLSYLPKNSRTLLNTPRKGPIISEIEPGEYLHIGFEKALIKILQKIPSNLIPDILKVDWSTDGAN